MTHVNNVTLTGTITNTPNYIPLPEKGTVMATFSIRDSDKLGERKTAYTVGVRAVGGVAEYINMNLSAGDRVLVSGIVCSRNKPVGGYFTNDVYILGRAVLRMENEFYE